MLFNRQLPGIPSLAVFNFIDSKSFSEILILMKYQLQGRYPDYDPIIPKKEKVQLYLNQTKKLLQWVKEKL